MFHGSMVAMITPMLATGEIDLSRLQQLIEHHIQQGTDAIILLGTTGEAATIDNVERKNIIETAVRVAQDRVPIIVGTGTHSTLETIYRTEQAMELGADAVLIVTPYYNRPTQEGLYQHYKAISEAVPCPIILYNVPSRTGCDLLPETVGRLCDIPSIIGLKEATGNLERARELFKMVNGRLELYSGDDASALAFMLQGGKGVISVTANVAAKAMHQMCAAALSSNIRLAGEINTKLMPLHKSLFVETNPIPVKWAVEQLGLIEGGIRLPLTSLSPDYYALIKEAMQTSGVI